MPSPATVGFIITKTGIVNLNTLTTNAISNSTITATVLIQTTNGERAVITGAGATFLEAQANAQTGVEAYKAAQNLDAESGLKVSASIAGGATGSAVAAAAGITGALPLVVAGLAGGALVEAWWDFSKAFWRDYDWSGGQSPTRMFKDDEDKLIRELLKAPTFYDDGLSCNVPFTSAKNWFPRHDPLTLDLDGDGLETTGVAATNPILFDHDGDGVKNGTGWVKPDDGFLVRDVNGNGSIDSGRELFGDNTIKSNGQLATDGFDALADLDSISNGGNADGVISNADAQFASLRVWRDLNQDGISQSNELFTLSSQNIASINVTKTANSQTLANGNQIADLGTFTRTDGSTGTAGAVTGNLADVNLASDTFHRTFPNVLNTSSVATLPDMQACTGMFLSSGSGKVRDLREAATQSTTLQTLLTQFSAATTRAGQMALIDQLLDAWADTGGMAESLDDRAAAATHTLADGSTVPYVVIYDRFGTVVRSFEVVGGQTSGGTGAGGGSSGGSFTGRDVDNPTLTQAYRDTIAAWTQKLHIIESFNGSYFFGLPNSSQTQGAVTGMTSTSSNTSGGSMSVITAIPITISYEQAQLDLLQQSYDAIRSSVYQALLLQTRLKPLLDQINLVIDSYSYTKCTSTRLPKAAAYLRNVSMLGECFPEASALSSLATAGALVPIRAATSACDKPAARLAASISSNMANSSRFKRSYSARTAGLSSILAFSSACVNNDSAFMFNLLHSCFSQSQFTRWRSLRFFNKTMQHHNTLPKQSAIKHTGNTLNTFKPQFKQTITKRFSMRLTQISTIHRHAVSQSKIATTQTFWQSQNICLYGIAVINDGVLHDINSNKYVTNKQAFTKIVAANDEEWRVRA